MDIRTATGLAPVADHSGTATTYYLVQRDSLKEETDGNHLEYVCEFHVAEGRKLEPHFHDNHEFFYVLSGSGRMQIAEEETAVGPGTLIRIPRNAVHTMWPDDGDRLHVFCFGLSFNKSGSHYQAVQTNPASS